MIELDMFHQEAFKYLYLKIVNRKIYLYNKANASQQYYNFASMFNLDFRGKECRVYNRASEKSGPVACCCNGNEILERFSVTKVTLESPMSVCQLVIKTTWHLRIIPVCLHVYICISLHISAYIFISLHLSASLWSFRSQPSCLSLFSSLNLFLFYRFWKLYLTIKSCVRKVVLEWEIEFKIMRQVFHAGRNVITPASLSACFK